jgi:hypothetical protein
LDTGLTRSRYTNPQDPLLDQGRSVVPVREATRNAHYLDASYHLLRNLSLTKTTKASLLLNYQHERLEPLFGSVAASAQPNKLLHQVGLVGQLGEVQVTFSHLRFNDNLDQIPSILKSLTRRSSLLVGLPLGALLNKPGQPSRWLPRLSYSYDRTHQFGAFIPSNAEFKAPQVPDQIATNQTLAAEWQSGRWRYGYQLNFSAQDNFGEKREGTKLLNLVHSFTLGLAPLPALELNLDVSAENLTSKDDNANKDQRRLDRSLRFGFNLHWRTSRNSALTAIFSHTAADSFGDLSRGSASRSRHLDLQWSWRFLGNGQAGQNQTEKHHLLKVQGQWFIRYARRSSRSRDDLFRLDSLLRGATLNTGLSFTFF